jgi:predicted ArsR family transcriptional regulator
MRLELLGLFTESDPLSIADMATRLGRPATSLYHHVQVLEDAGVLRRAGTRPKGKRFETLFELIENRLELAVDPDDGDTAQQAGRTMAAALRMAERDFMAALDRDDILTDGPQRNLTGLRTHMRLSPDLLAQLNERLRAIEELLQTAAGGEPGPDDQFISLTLLLAPLRGRRVGDESSPTSDPGDLS